MRSNKRILKLWLLLCAMLIALVCHNAQAQDEAPVARQYNQEALTRMNNFEIREARYLLILSLKEKEHPFTYYLLGHLKLITNEYDSACFFLERSLQLAPADNIAYPDLFQAYMALGKWHKAKAIKARVEIADPKIDPYKFVALDIWLGRARLSVAVVAIALLLAAGLFFIPLFKRKASPAAVTPPIRIIDIFLVATTVSGILYAIFYIIAPWVVGQNEYHPLAEYTRSIRWYSFEHDGAESFVMYMLMFAAALLTAALIPRLANIKAKRALYLSVGIALFLVAGYYFFSIGFYPPYREVEPGYVFVPLLIALLAVWLYFLYRKTRPLTVILIVLLAAFCGLVTIASPSCSDLEYICAPALRLYHGFKVSEIYFQYDLFLSFLAYAWMKMSLALEAFPYIGNVSFFLFFVGSFFFMDRFMKTKGLSVIFLVALVLVRIYIQGYDDPVIIQVSPLRLDLWLILLLIARARGVHHWSVGLAVGLLVLFHRNLGLIYMAAYIELLLALFVTDVLTATRENGFSGKTTAAIFAKHARINAASLFVVAASVVLCLVLFHELFSPSAITYRKIGVGMLPVARTSFYWYAPVIVSALVAFLYHFRQRLGEKYVSVGLFIVLLAIGNSMYFFGRSHENNVLNIAAVLVFVLFVLFDIFIFLTARPAKPSLFSARGIAWALPVAFILFTSYTYTGKTVTKLTKQCDNLKKGRFILPFKFDYMDTAAVREATHGNPNVFVLDTRLDFYFYYYGHYKPMGMYNPMEAWIYKKDLLKFIQDLLDKHYSVVYNAINTDLAEYINELKFNHVRRVRDMVALDLVDVPLLLPQSQASVYHVGLKDTLPREGISHVMAGLGTGVTMEFILRPHPVQLSQACIMGNLNWHQFEHLQGFTFRHDSATGKYMFEYSDGSDVMPTVFFDVDTHKWDYVSIIVKGNVAHVFVNGVLAGKANATGAAKLNSELTVIIGNRRSGKDWFRGDIREISITNDGIDSAEVVRRWQRIETELNNGAPSASATQ